MPVGGRGGKADIQLLQGGKYSRSVPLNTSLAAPPLQVLGSATKARNLLVTCQGSTGCRPLVYRHSPTVPKRISEPNATGHHSLRRLSKARAAVAKKQSGHYT